MPRLLVRIRETGQDGFVTSIDNDGFRWVFVDALGYAIPFNKRDLEFVGIDRGPIGARWPAMCETHGTLGWHPTPGGAIGAETDHFCDVHGACTHDD